MGIKSKIKYWLHLKLKHILEFEKLPIQIPSCAIINVGRDTFHNGNFETRGAGKIKIGSFCAFGKDVKLITSNHDYNYPVLQYGFYKKYFNEKIKKNKLNSPEFIIEIGSDVWIGDNVCILPNVKIGHGAIIGTGSIVTKSVEPYTIVGGVPAKFIKNRFLQEIKNKMLQSEWWNWDDETIKSNKDFFLKNYNI